MKRALVVLALAGCTTTTTVMMEDPCACVVLPTMNGALSMAMGRQAVGFDGDAEGSVVETLPISGFLFAAEMDFYSSTGVKVEGLAGIGFEAVWSEPVDMRRPAAMVSFLFNEDELSSVASGGGRSFDLGPEGGQVTVNEIVPRPEGGWRVRASYAVQACDEGGGGCENLSGSFAFDAGQLPEAAAASGLVAAAS
jgi:hypothetical protein